MYTRLVSHGQGKLWSHLGNTMHDRPYEAPSSAFNLVFVCVLALTLLSLAGCFYSSFWLSAHKQAALAIKLDSRDVASTLEDVEKLTEVLRYAFTLGCGAVFGLIGGRGIK